ncbi:MAG: hypothetical protein F6J90_30345 [Moorea sp. SIOASIH]|uniref:hypothetical protein n=1 Tax=Moorena sp. SIOASIH TaxID=2607817 RepID=UPI0013B7BD28|nr:hypothetical protein [Moorena sp. SIOASIH]NEO40410.1 hypothetical protein [Moorena sp. SIOASIH]
MAFGHATRTTLAFGHATRTTLAFGHATRTTFNRITFNRWLIVVRYGTGCHTLAHRPKIRVSRSLTHPTALQQNNLQQNNLGLLATLREQH